MTWLVYNPDGRGDPSSPTESRRSTCHEIRSLPGRAICFQAPIDVNWATPARPGGSGIILNDRFINRDFAGMHFLMDITPFVRWDQPNSLSLRSMYPTQSTNVKTVEIRYYDDSDL